MIDRQEIIKDIDICLQHPYCGKDCPYYSVECPMDVISILREREPAKQVLVDRQCEVRPYHYEQKGFCPKCHQEIKLGFNRNYCGFCGQKVKWDGRTGITRC